MFRPIVSQLNAPLIEEDILRFWQLHRVFKRSQDWRKGEREFVFYEGPPTANGQPSIHHIPARAFKDIFLRYKAMRGYHVVRRGGWDTHGLPVEIGVEQQLGFTSKSQIEVYGIAEFNALCRESVFAYIQDWQRFSDRIAYWVDMEDAYVTYTNEYIESVWWILKTLWDKDLLYQGYKVVPYCPRCGTPLSDHEVAQGYSQVEDPYVYVRMPLVDEPDTSLLVWTTTPWTLPGNVAVAVHPDVEYAVVRRSMPEGGRERLIVARALLEQVFGEEPVSIIETFKGKKLKGRRYHPLFTFLYADKPAHYVVLQEYVSVDDGSGLVHIAPAFGAEDLQVAMQFDLPVLMTVDDDGKFINEVRPWSGRFVKDADPLIIQNLEARGLLYRAGRYTHSYPFCWRCDTPLLYTARGTWYIRTSEHKDRLVGINREINWIPDHFRDGRFGNWLENNVDWALGRERYWGTPLPIWECSECRYQVAIGSLDELSQLTGRDLSDLDLHRPDVDQIVFPCPECSAKTGSRMHRVPDLIDVWFDSGSMPVAQWHFPYDNREMFRKQYPADFICEAVDQTRGWFYALHAISVLLFNSLAFKNVICLGLFLDEEGRKMSKSRGNAIDPWGMFNEYGSDAFRWYLYTSGAPGQERRFSLEQVKATIRNFSLPLWNVYAFFVIYANLDGWQPNAANRDIQARTALDRWLRSELQILVQTVSDALDAYDVPGATRPIQNFLDDLSKWYLRRSRRRFWRSASDNDEDKNAAYATLFQALLTLSKLLGPLMPFLAEALYQNLGRVADEAAPISVHLNDWPEPNLQEIDAELNEDMRLVKKLASLGHAARNQAGIKVRQPLAEAAFYASRSEELGVLEKYADLLTDELNVKQVRALDSAEEVVSYTLRPLPKQLGQKYQSQFPQVLRALEALEPEPAARTLLAGKVLQVNVDGETLDILPDEIEVILNAHEDLVVATDGSYLAALQTVMTPDLKREGLAREFVRRVQELRKEADFEIADRIRLYVQATPDLAAAIQAFREYVLGETLTEELIESAPPEEAVQSEAWFDGQWMKVGALK